MRDQLGDVDAKLADGETASVLKWLRDNVHIHGSLYGPAELMKRASGQDLSSGPLLDYLEIKYGEMLDL